MPGIEIGMKIVIVSGSHSGVGKTKVAEVLLRLLEGWSALKVTVTHRGRECPVRKESDCHTCDELKDDFSIIDNKKIIEIKGKDTARLKEAGARKVLWLKARPHALREGLRKAIPLFKMAKGLIIESNSALKYIKPDVAILVKNKNSLLKPSAKKILNKIDLVVTL
ncbi:MAG: hypothetical protein A2Y00_01300 [Omnitrophica WOR_2 bacterium GWF2_43_52]|nr:MAG: hypothetical protein A2Y01_02975 [Omnitrophica WOR_2 bacterium GWC2_44_8]OGX22044.1 MAG: hypothetical protein A2Y00_01300 [Omnitrophica WOR_2 bacterium GWF2_43_52]OGX54512.1 MAG: hypothetical protein A2460_07240 [Omnitrophica WOR_2 bacterium RIFOXYC2_FULL_43_9]HAH20115.1 hypothetical protein [Candidatus Omnitrophota bacterium]HBG63182.1 hypothetical protein [Candidatus Omnitrophota bacterium]